MALTGGLDTFDRSIKLATQGLDPKQIAVELAAFAKDELRTAIASGEASSSYDRYVNGRRGAPEESVIPPGPIVYVFGYWPLIIRAALEELRRRVPVRSGRYASGFIVMAADAVAQKYSDIPSDAEVVIFNARPYTRKMEVGANRTGAKHFANASQAVNRQFKGTAVCRELYLNVQAGIHADVPYLLRGFRRVAASKGRGRFAPKVRRDRQPGQPITYPALVINMVQ